METVHIRLDYPLNHVKEPIIYHLVKDYHLIPNVYKANIDVHTGGMLVLTLEGHPEQVQAGIAFLRGLGIQTTILEN